MVVQLHHANDEGTGIRMRVRQVRQEVGNEEAGGTEKVSILQNAEMERGEEMTVEQKARYEALVEVRDELNKWAVGHTENGLLEAAIALHEAVIMVDEKLIAMIQQEIKTGRG